MRRRAMWMPAAGLAVIGAAALTAGLSALEEELTLEQVPPAVKATILQQANGATITEIERETRDGEVTYEAEFRVDGQTVEIKMAPDGTLLGRQLEDEGDDEDDLKIGDVPEPARRVLLGMAGGAPILEVERETEAGVVVYGAAWRKNGVLHEAEVTADGILLEVEEGVARESMPPAVQAAVAKHFPGRPQLKIVKKTVMLYEVEARIDGQEVELYVLPTGRVIDQPDDDDDHNGGNGDDDDDDDGEEDDD